jgi:hypothetical protein
MYLVGNSVAQQRSTLLPRPLVCVLLVGGRLVQFHFCFASRPVFRPYFGAFEMTGLAEQIKLLYDSKLYSNVVALVSALGSN